MTTQTQEPDQGRRDDELWESERIASDAIGRLMALWGFKRNMGRIWTVLYLSDEPLTSKQLRQRLQLSSGAVSMTLSELSRWAVVRKIWVRGDRRDFYVAEGNVWKMVSRVVRERERAEVVQAMEAFDEALEALDRIPRRHAADAMRVRFQRERIQRLLELARLGRAMLDALINHARLDASWLPRFRLGRSSGRS